MHKKSSSPTLRTVKSQAGKRGEQAKKTTKRKPLDRGAVLSAARDVVPSRGLANL